MSIECYWMSTLNVTAEKSWTWTPEVTFAWTIRNTLVPRFNTFPNKPGKRFDLVMSTRCHRLSSYLKKRVFNHWDQIKVKGDASTGIIDALRLGQLLYRKGHLLHYSSSFWKQFIDTPARFTFSITDWLPLRLIKINVTYISLCQCLQTLAHLTIVFFGKNWKIDRIISSDNIIQ